MENKFIKIYYIFSRVHLRRFKESEEKIKFMKAKDDYQDIKFWNHLKWTIIF